MELGRVDSGGRSSAVVGVDSAWRPTLNGMWSLSVGGHAEFVLAVDAKVNTLVGMLGWHLIFSCYGFWLPNDQRGSGSTRVRAQHIYDAGGDATKVYTTRSVADRPHDVRLRRLAKEALKYPAVKLSGVQARAVGRGIANICPKAGLTIHACAIMPDHVHVAVAAHEMDGAEIIACVKRAGTRGMNDEGIHPMRDSPRANGSLPSPWAGGGWKVMLFTADQMRGTIRYVERNPVRAGLKPQRWSFVAPYDD
jgi:REP element-mobilizing transposase RayT